jgi:hypothetical protein
MFPWVKRRRRVRATTATKHYLAHKESTRSLTLARLQHYNEHYQLTWNRVAIRNQRRCWGSCSANKNLNFNYKIQFLPPHLRDYIIVHELCHLTHLNHGKEFWNLVAEQVPDYAKCIKELREIDAKGHKHLLTAM